MITRQAIRSLITLIFLSAELSACASPNQIPPPPTATLSTPTMMVAAAPKVSPTPVQTNCLAESGQVFEDVVQATKPPQQFLIYLPPCYEYSTDRYPVLYLLHGQTYTQDQWLRIGAIKVADNLIFNQESEPFIIVLPDDRYWNVAAGVEFGSRLISSLIPYVDATYRTRAERNFRALGGLSRGGGWTAKLGFDHPELFGALGLHSPAFKESPTFLEDTIKKIPATERPKLWIDIGEEDTQLGDSLIFEEILAGMDYVHIFHRFSGNHTEEYWISHTEQYLRWYVKIWQENSASP